MKRTPIRILEERDGFLEKWMDGTLSTDFVILSMTKTLSFCTNLYLSFNKIRIATHPKQILIQTNIPAIGILIKSVMTGPSKISLPTIRLGISPRI
jgi:hypothetical protein